MKIFSTILIIALSCLKSISQDKELYIEYNFSKQITNNNYTSYLTTNNKESVFTLQRHVIFASNDGTDEKKTFTDYYYKNYKTNTIIYKDYESSGNDFFYIKESLNKLKWTLHEGIKKILGYQCQKATTNYRGRNYTAYFTNNIPFKAAPWKFRGLPGVMLSIFSEDGYIKIVATKLQVRENKTNLLNPYQKEEFITWTKFVDIYKKRQKSFNEKLLALVKKQKVEGFSLKTENDSRIEIIIESDKAKRN